MVLHRKNSQKFAYRIINVPYFEKKYEDGGPDRGRQKKF